MDDVNDSLIEMLTERLVDLLGNSEHTEALFSQATDALQSYMDQMSSSVDTLSDDAKNSIIDSIISTIGIATDTPGIKDVVETAANIDTSSFDAPAWNGEFTDGCWNVCLISSGEGSLRMKCGYYG